VGCYVGAVVEKGGTGVVEGAGYEGAGPEGGL